MIVCPYNCTSYLPCKSHLFCAVLFCHLWHAPYYSTLSLKRRDFRKNFSWVQNMCCHLLYKLS